MKFPIFLLAVFLFRSAESARRSSLRQVTKNVVGSQKKTEKTEGVFRLPKQRVTHRGNLNGVPNKLYPPQAKVFENFEPLTGDWGFLPMNSTQYGYDCLSAQIDPEFEMPGWDNEYCIQECLQHCFDKELTNDIAIWPQPNQLRNMRNCMLIPGLRPCMVPFGLFHTTSGIKYAICDDQNAFTMTFTPGMFDVVDPSRVTRADLILTGGSCDANSFAQVTHYDGSNCAVKADEHDITFNLSLSKLGDQQIVMHAGAVMNYMGFTNNYHFMKDKTDAIVNAALTGFYDSGCIPTGVASVNDSVIFEFTSWIHGIDAVCSTVNVCSECHRHNCDWCQIDFPLEANPQTKKMGLVAFHNGQPDGSGCGIAETECMVLQGRFFKKEPDVKGQSHCPSHPNGALGNPWRMMTHKASPRMKVQNEMDINSREDI